MRKIIENFTPGFSDGLRSDYNGPIEVAEFINSSYFDENDVFKRYYRKVKPYERVETEFSLSRWLDVTLLSGAPKSYWEPSTAEIAASVKQAVFNEFNETMFDLVSSPEAAVNKAIDSALNYGQVLMYVTAAEASKTLLLFKNLYTRLFTIVKDLYLAVKKLNVIATFDIITDVWLELRYGWRPLKGEIEGIAKALLVTRPNGIKSAYGLNKADKRSHKTSSVSLRNVHVKHGDFITVFDVTMSNFDDVTRKTGFNYVNKPGSRNVDWQALFGLDFQSLASTAWELIPFSFIVDMFLNIGNLLQANNYVDQVDSFNGYLTNRLTCEISAVATDILTVQEPLVPDLRFLGLTARHNLYFQNAITEFRKQEALDVARHELPVPQPKEGISYDFFNRLWLSTRNGDISGGYVTGFVDSIVDMTPAHYNANIDKGQTAFAWFLIPLREKYYAQWIKDQKQSSLDKINRLNELDFALKDLPRDKFDNLFARMFSPVPASFLRSQAEVADQYLTDYPYDYGTMYQHVPRHLWTDLKYALRMMYFSKHRTYMHPAFAVTRKGPAYFPVRSDFLPYEKNFKALFLERIEKHEFNMQFTADTDLKDAQMADLAAFGYKLGRFLSKKI